MALRFAAGGALAGVAAYGLYELSKPKKDALKMIISGGPGSGKGTQCDLLVTKHVRRADGPWTGRGGGARRSGPRG